MTLNLRGSWLLSMSALDVSVDWRRSLPSNVRDVGARWPGNRLGAHAHALSDQFGHPIFISLGGHSSFTHSELWIGSLEPLQLNCFELGAQSLLWLWGHTSCLIAERLQLWVFGGRGPQGDISNSVHCISTSPTLKVDLVPALNAPPPRYRHAAALDGNLMVIFGGVIHLGSAFKKRRYDNTVAVFDTQALTWSYPAIAAGPKPSNRADHTLTRIREGLFLLMFGCLEDDDKPCNEIWELARGASWSWRQISCSGSPLAGLFAHSAVLWNNCVVVFGGMKGASAKNLSYCNDLSVVDTVTWHHHAVPSKNSPSGRCGHGSTLFGNSMVRLSASCCYAKCIFVVEVSIDSTTVYHSPLPCLLFDYLYSGCISWKLQ